MKQVTMRQSIGNRICITRPQLRYRSRLATAALLIWIVSLLACSSSPSADDEMEIVEGDPSQPVWGEPLTDLPEVLDATDVPEVSQASPSPDAEPADQGSVEPSESPDLSPQRAQESTSPEPPPSQESLEAFAIVYMAVMDLHEDYQLQLASETDTANQAALTEELEDRSREILNARGLTAEEFNAIGTRIEEDPGLRDQVQSIIDAHSSL